jgi:hypothetical protein
MIRYLMILSLAATPLFAAEEFSEQAPQKENPSIFEARAERMRQNLERRWGHNDVIDGPIQAEEERPYVDPQIDQQRDWGKKEGSVD